MARAVGVDIGSRSIKILQLEKTGGKLKVTHFFCFELPFGADDFSNPDLLIEPIRQVFREHGLHRGNVALSLPTQDCILREFTIDFTQDEHIKKIIKYEAEKYLHSHPIEKVIIDYQKLQVYEDKSRLFVAAAPKAILAQRLEILEKSDLDPISVDLDICALGNVVQLCPQVMAKQTVMLLDLGATSTNIIIFSQGKIQHARATRLGVNLDHEKAQDKSVPEGALSQSQVGDIDWDIEDKLIISLPVAEGVNVERMVLVQDSDGDAQLEEQKHEIFQRLVQELRRTMLTVKLEQPIEMICLTGGGCQLSGICEHLQEKLGIETIQLDFSSAITTADSYDDLFIGGAVAFGLALKVLGMGSSELEFRREEFGYTNRFEFIKMPLAILVTLVFLWVLLLCYNIQSSRIEHEQAVELLARRMKTVVKRAIPEMSLSSDRLKLLKTARRKMQRAIPDESMSPVADVFKLWKLIFDKFDVIQRRNSQYITLTKIEIDPGEAVIEGMVDEKRYARILSALEEQMQKIKGVERSKGRLERTKKGDKRRYTMTVKFVEKAP